MKRALFTTLLLALTIASYAQGYTSMNTRAEQYLRNTQDTLVIKNPKVVTVDLTTDSYSIRVEGEHNGYDYDITFNTRIEPAHYISVQANGIADTGAKEFRNPLNVTLMKNDGESSTSIKGEAYAYEIKSTGSIHNTKTISKESDSNWDFNVPFGNGNRKKHNSKAHFSFDLLGDLEFGLGLVSATEQAPGMDVGFGNSGWEFTLNNLFKWEYRPVRSTSLSLGFGVDWRNYRMTGDRRFLKQDNNIIIAPYPEGADVNFSRIKVFSMTLELLLRQKITKKVSVAAGPVVNFNTHASIKTRYAVGKGKEKEGFKETTSNIHQKPVTFDLKGVLSIDPLSFYFKYSPVNTLETSFGPAFRSMSAGVLIEL